MKKSVAISILCVCFLCVPSFADPEESTPDVAQYFPLDQGRWWAYVEPRSQDTFTLEVDGTKEICGKKCVRVVGSDGTEFYFTGGEKGLLKTRAVYPDGYVVDFCPPLELSPAQAYPGAEACVKPFEGDIKKGRGVSKGWYLFVVEEVAKLKVPAGTFENCLRMTLLSHSYADPRSAGVLQREIVWYAPNVGIVKWLRPDSKVSLVLEDYSHSESD
jgi:hypothetical protein